VAATPLAADYRAAARALAKVPTRALGHGRRRTSPPASRPLPSLRPERSGLAPPPSEQERHEPIRKILSPTGAWA